MYQYLDLPSLFCIEVPKEVEDYFHLWALHIHPKFAHLPSKKEVCGKHFFLTLNEKNTLSQGFLFSCWCLHYFIVIKSILMVEKPHSHWIIHAQLKWFWQQQRILILLVVQYPPLEQTRPGFTQIKNTVHLHQSWKFLSVIRHYSNKTENSTIN